MSQPHRPNLLDLRSNSHTSNASSSSKPLRSPRMHIAGEAPPELSPLDAFAMQSRMLAKQLKASEKEGNRISRLPPLTMESPVIVQGRSDYFRSLSNESESENGLWPGELNSAGLGLRTEYEEAFEEAERPKSMHPRMSRIPPTPDDETPPVPQHMRNASRGRQLGQIDEDPGFFGARRDRSPSPIQSDAQSIRERPFEPPRPRKDSSLPPPSPLQNESRPDSEERPKPGSMDELGLAPPRALFPQRTSSIVSSPLLPPEDEVASNMGASTHSLPLRKLSSGSAAFANTMASPALGHFKRSPSVGSESSILPRPSFNFSRPMSRAGTPSFDMPSRQASSDSQPSFIFADESAQTSISMHSEAFLQQPPETPGPGAPSYIYSKFTLPRGKMVQRDDESEGQMDHPTQQGAVTTAPPSPPLRPAGSSGPVADDAASLLSSVMRPSMDTSRGSSSSMENPRLPADYPPVPRSQPSQEMARASEDSPRGRSRTSDLHEPFRGRGVTPSSHTGTSDSTSTVRPPPTARSNAPTASEMSAEEHLAKGVECHENGSLQESTYHLRYAARQNNPTAMLLYALACRHGWGMRANQKEGVSWLRKAADYAQIEIADDEDQAKGGKHVDAVERRTRKAQFALSIYELGVSHMNGWGIEQDKALGLRCFEIAGTWGDVDALAEAGFCYAQGIGCKKDLKKSARFYRMAEAKGMSMVGNSWIHKPKYTEDDSSSTAKSPKRDKKKSRSKSRTRAMFGLKS
ncbi:putative cell cycle inhibitor Nif1 [Emericellopsis atlantica]|uniref:Cell cycle inhibitor Nif1 n=1 Tax=Emericellopsis atlantica TaxID=2614577 RepID=A0A9P8CSA8_9HYPO|nr:putative cell cycle inhibitor Nif1 [Emericellopsis atlantica]KAG9257879.1 putative cell cycle inhibitor Nif1 [Emericellopsis atlantica]